MQEKSGGVTVEMLNCGLAELDVQDKRLNEFYRVLMAGLPGKDKSALRASQRDWPKSFAIAKGFVENLIQHKFYDLQMGRQQEPKASANSQAPETPAMLAREVPEPALSR